MTDMSYQAVADWSHLVRTAYSGERGCGLYTRHWHMTVVHGDEKRTAEYTTNVEHVAMRDLLAMARVPRDAYCHIKVIPDEAAKDPRSVYSGDLEVKIWGYEDAPLGVGGRPIGEGDHTVVIYIYDSPPGGEHREPARLDIGSLVRPVVGGPTMTVTQTREAGGSDSLAPGMVRCAWFDGSRMYSGEFSERILRTATAEHAIVSSDPAEPGDLVRLQSGGPDMVVDYVSVEPLHRNVQCVWFDGSQPRSAVIHMGALYRI